MSGATLIAIAIVVFVLVVSAAVVRDWPIAGLVGAGDEEAAVSSARPAAAGTGLTAFLPGVSRAKAAAAGDDGGAAGKGDGRRDSDAPGQGAGGVDGEPGGPGGGEATGGGGEGSTPTQSPGSPSGGGGGDTTSGGGGSGGGGGGGGGTPSSPSSQVTSTVNQTVDQVDQTATGGALEETGVTQVTEEAVNGVAGPESVVGKTVDEAAGAVGGIVGSKP
ncbi:MAG TPA: hypothetical protein VGV69_09610 [Solirubrobacterales bacterium]|nr:hypothetical protein [Solirubrobacterales bacterium]